MCAASKAELIMSTIGLFNPACVSANLSAGGKKQLLQEMSALACKCPCVADKAFAPRDILSAVMERERLGTTGIGSGVAIPHARIEGLEKMTAAFARLETPVDYDAVDDRPVDLVVMLLAPLDAGAEHLRALAQVSRLLRREDTRNRLRNAPSAESLFTMLTEQQSSSAA